MAKAKTLALKSKTRAIKTRLIIFSLLRNKKILMSSVSEKLRTLMGQQDHDHHHHSNKQDEDEDEGEEEEESTAIVVHNNDAVYPSVHESLPNPSHTEFGDDFENQENQEEECGENDKYPDLTHRLFDDMELGNGGRGGSVIDLVKKSKPEGEEFRLEDEIDLVADLFIKRFHRQMLIQKQLSFKRYQDQLDRSA